MALQAAIRYPGVVSGVIVISFPFSTAGFFPEVQAAFARMPQHADLIAAQLSKSPLGALYPGVKWGTLFTKLGRQNSAPRDWSAHIQRMAAPALLVFADADAVLPANIAEFYRLLGGGLRDGGQDGSGRAPSQLAVIPGATHYNILGAGAVTRFAMDFLSNLPLRSAHA